MNSSNTDQLSDLSYQQKLLLQASLLSGEEALSAWREWRKLVDIPHLYDFSMNWLNLLYENLAYHQVKDFEMSRLKGIYKRTWYVNRLKLKKILPIINALQKNNIAVVVFGDLALISSTYKCQGRFSIEDYALFIRAKDNILAIKILENLGWTTKVLETENNFRCKLSNIDFHNQDKISIYNHLFWGNSQNYIDNEIWNNSIDGSIDNIQTKFLSISDEFLFLCKLTNLYHKPLYPSYPQLQRLIKLMLIINNKTQPMDWERLIKQAEKYKLSLLLKNVLMCLQEIIPSQIPDWTILRSCT